MFMVFLLALHWKHARQYTGGFLLLGGSYFVGFGPLLLHFIRKPNLYLGRGASLLIWSTAYSDQFRRFPPGLENDLASVVRELAWNQHSHFTRHHILWAPVVTCRKRAPGPGRCAAFVALASSAAFLILASGLGVLLVGGTLVAYPNSVPPLINHWTPAFPAFYIALAVPVGAWITAGQSELEPRFRWILPVTVAIALLVLGWCNLHFYFHHYYADPESLKSKAYRSAQRNYEVQTAQSRYSASLGPTIKFLQ